VKAILPPYIVYSNLASRFAIIIYLGMLASDSIFSGTIVKIYFLIF
jgi:hypothetical protein